MSNMSYCRFENTSNDLQDCINAMDEAATVADLDLSSYEEAAFDRMAEQCQRFLALHESLAATKPSISIVSG